MDGEPRRTGLGRRAALGGAGALLLPAGTAQGFAPGEGWPLFRARFVAAEGRVVEAGQAGRTLSRHQALALQFAVRANDRAAFERMLRWTLTHLALPRSGLLVQRWETGEGVAVQDARNDTLADLHFAWALLLAARSWNEPVFAQFATRVAAGLEQECVLRAGPRHLLLPACYGYVNADRAAICLATHAFPALRALLVHTRNPLWQRLGEDALKLLGEARFSAWSLPADWVELAPGGAVAGLATGFAPRFGSEAAQLPLSLLWAGETGAPCLANIRAAWAHHGARRPPRWIGLPDGRFSTQAGGAELEAIADLVLARPGRVVAVPTLLQASADPWAALTILASGHVRGVLDDGAGFL